MTLHALLLDRDGVLYGAGYGVNGALGDGATSNNLTFVPIASPSPLLAADDCIVRIYAGFTSSTFVTRHGLAYMSGQRTSTTQTDVFTQAAGALTSKRVVQSVTSHGVYFFLCDDGAVYSSGVSGTGGLGDGGVSGDTTSMILISSQGDLSGKCPLQLSASKAGCVVLTSDSSIIVWGFNDHGQLGLGTTSSYNLPVHVPSSGTDLSSGDLLGKIIDKVATSANHTICFSSDGDFFATGRNNDRELGFGNTTLRRELFELSSFVPPSGYTMLDIDCGNRSSIMLATNGRVVTWGRFGGNTPSIVSTSEYENKTVSTVCAGDSCYYIMTTDGGVYGMGGNPYGNLGLGSTGNQSNFVLTAASVGSHGALTNFKMPSPSSVSMRISNFSIRWSTYEISQELWQDL